MKKFKIFKKQKKMDGDFIIGLLIFLLLASLGVWIDDLGLKIASQILILLFSLGIYGIERDKMKTIKKELNAEKYIIKEVKNERRKKNL